MSTQNVSEQMERSEPMARVDVGLGVCHEGAILDFHANNFLRVYINVLQLHSTDDDPDTDDDR
jgi:hypothetical protein